MNTRTPKSSKVKAKLLYVGELPKTESEAPYICSESGALTPNPVFVLPATPEAIQEMRERVAREIYESSPAISVRPWDVEYVASKNRWRKIADRVLAVLFPPLPKQAKKRGAR